MGKATGSVNFDGGSDTIRLGPGFDWQSTGRVYIDSGALEIASNTVFWTETGSTSSANTWEDTTWDSGVAADADHEYVVWAMKNDGTGGNQTRYMRTPAAKTGTFPGKRLALEGVGDNLVGLYLKTKDLTIGDLRLGREAHVVFASYNEGQVGEQRLSGKITVVNPAGSKTYIKGTRSTQSRYHNIAADLVGGTNAYIRLMSYEAHDSDYQFTGDNSKYLGAIDACWYNAANAAHANFYGANTVGGNPTSKLVNGLVVDHSEIIFNETADIDQPNRGFYANNTDNYVNVVDGKTVTWAGPLNFSASDTTLTKTGAGTIVFKGATESAGVLNVSAGKVVLGANAVQNLLIGTVADGAAVELAAPTVGEDGKVALQDYLYIPAASYDTEKSAAENLAAYAATAKVTVPSNLGLTGSWAVTYTAEAITSGEDTLGYMIKVSAKKGGFLVIIR